ncbi:MAG: transmembrane 220 family protein [Lunatimonas sp.]|uniref:transmembrane 220 family protein n=1 Tax=Lunatimonas sp. TaxID=2060141 RepID=UPI00263B929F|nr:transmembrane 220 family protein [Lunatimonas sp.]MCC5937841.1 transmembrane 220 family protein [Lunatimonas sp.]
MTQGWKIFFGIWTGLFLLFAYWQFNDPDPEWWVPAYLIGALISGLAASGRFHLRILVITTLLYLTVSLFFWPQDIFGWVSQEWEQKNLAMKTDAMEINREFFGLLTLALITGLAYWVGRGQLIKKQQL